MNPGPRNTTHGTWHGTLDGYRIHMSGNEDVPPSPPCEWCLTAAAGVRHRRLWPCPCGRTVRRPGARCHACTLRVTGMLAARTPLRRRWVRRRGILILAAA